MRKKDLDQIIEEIDKSSNKEIDQYGSFRPDNQALALLISKINSDNIDNYFSTKKQQIELIRFYAKKQPIVAIEIFRHLKKQGFCQINKTLVFKELILHCNNPFVISLFHEQFPSHPRCILTKIEIKQNIQNEHFFFNIINFFNEISIESNPFMNMSDIQAIRFLDENYFDLILKLKDNLHKIHSSYFFDTFKAHAHRTIPFMHKINYITNARRDYSNIINGRTNFLSLDVTQVKTILQKGQIDNLALIILYIYKSTYFLKPTFYPFAIINELFNSNKKLGDKLLKYLLTLNIEISYLIVKDVKKEIEIKKETIKKIKKVDPNAKNIIMLLEKNNVLNKSPEDIISLSVIFSMEINSINPSLFNHLDLVESCIQSNPLKISDPTSIIEKANKYLNYISSVSDSK